MATERFKRQYGGLPRLAPSGAAQAYGQIRSALAGFTSAAGTAAIQGLQQQSLAQAEEQALAYDPTSGAPVLSERQNKAADVYNKMVTKSYQESVYNDQLVALKTLATEYKDSPQSYMAASEEYRRVLANESGDLENVALSVFDGIRSRFESDIRSNVIEKTLEAAKATEKTSLQNTENEIFSSIQGADFDEVRTARLTDGYKQQVLSSTILDNAQKVSKVTNFNKRIYIGVQRSIINDLLDKGEVSKAVKYVNDIERKQKTTGQLSSVYKDSGLTPKQIAEDLNSVIKDYSDDLALQIKIQDDTDKQSDQVVADARIEALKDIAELGNELTINDVKAYRNILEPTEYEAAIKVAQGNVSQQFNGLANNYFIEMKASARKGDMVRMEELKKDAVEQFVAGRISKTQYDNIVAVDEGYRFQPGRSMFEAAEESFKAAKLTPFIYLVSTLESKFNQWSLRNPEATPEEATQKATEILKSNEKLYNALTSVQQAFSATPAE